MQKEHVLLVLKWPKMNSFGCFLGREVTRKVGGIPVLQRKLEFWEASWLAHSAKEVTAELAGPHF